MAWLEQASDSGNFKICLRWNGRKKRKSLPTDDPKTAQAILLRFEETVALVERGRLELPASGDIMTFLLSDGKLSESPLANPKPSAKNARGLSKPRPNSKHRSSLPKAPKKWKEVR